MAKLKLTYPVFRHAASLTSGTGALRVLADGLDPHRTLYISTSSTAVGDALAAAIGPAGGRLDAGNHFVKPPGEPGVAGIEAAAAFIGDRLTHTIVAVGGGSVLDLARLAWARSAGLLDLAGGGQLVAGVPAERPRFWLVPTTCGTGAEAADVAVYERADGRKQAIVTPLFMADRVILDARLLHGLRPAQIAGFVCDVLSHAIEAYLSLVPSYLGRESAASALQIILANYPAAPTPSRLERLLEASFQGGVAAANCSVGIVHAAAHSLGVDGVSHGVANAAGLLDGLRFNAAVPQMANLLARIGLHNVDELAGKLAPVIADALGELTIESPVWRLADPGYRRTIAERMLDDTAIRSNPRRPANDEEVLQYLADVHRTVEGLCRRTS